MQIIEDQIITVDGANGDMSDAIDQARASISEFFVAYRNPQPHQTSFHIKARFEDGDSTEHIWLSDLDFHTKPATGVVANEPGITTVSYMERVPFLPDQISDWMYMESGKMIGGFTTKVLLRAQSKRNGLLGLLKQRLTM